MRCRLSFREMVLGIIFLDSSLRQNNRNERKYSQLTRFGCIQACHIQLFITQLMFIYSTLNFCILSTTHLPSTSSA